MKNPPASSRKRAFTLLELLVAMAITTIIVTVLVSITAIAIDTWNRSRSELRAARQAKSMVDSMARDLEALVTRRGNDFEWLSAKQELPVKSSSAATLVFMTAATDRYNGEIGSTKDLGGDVSCVGYQLAWRDPIGGGNAGNFQTFVLNRHLVDPDQTFKSLLGKTDLAEAFTTFSSQLESQESFVCENVFQFAVTFNIQVTTTSTGPTGTTTIENKQETIGPTGSVDKFSIKGTGIETTPKNDTLSAGKITSVGISLSVLSDAGIDQLRNSPALANNAAWLAKNSYQYSKLVQIPGM